MQYMNEEQKVTCPKCQSTLVIVIGSQRHCNACSHDFCVSRNPIADACAARKASGVVGGCRQQ